MVRVCILLLHFTCFWRILFHFYENISIPKEIDFRKKKGHAGPNEWNLQRLWLKFSTIQMVQVVLASALS